MSDTASMTTAVSTSITTWNINSVRLRAPLVTRFLAERAPDVLCLQEIKCQTHEFPTDVFAKAGYTHQAVNGFKGYHGVATLSRHPFEAVTVRDFCGQKDGRHIAVTFGDDAPGALAGTEIHNLYVPAGGDEPDREANPKFGHKLDFMAELAQMHARDANASDAHTPDARRRVLVGDLNIAPGEHDVWSHKQLLKVVSHTPVEVEAMAKARAAADWIDVARRFVGSSEKLYTWWSYRSRDWRASNRGRRLDHIWVTPDLEPALGGFEVMDKARGWDKPSDHVPVTVRLTG